MKEACKSGDDERRLAAAARISQSDADGHNPCPGAVNPPVEPPLLPSAWRLSECMCKAAAVLGTDMQWAWDVCPSQGAWALPVEAAFAAMHLALGDKDCDHALGIGTETEWLETSR